MTRSEFLARFDQQVSAAISAAESRLGKELPSERIIRLHGAGLGGKPVSASEAGSLLWLGDDLFFGIIDIAVTAYDGTTVELFVRPSGHPPAPWSQTWEPDGAGPFKQIASAVIEDHGSST